MSIRQAVLLMGGRGTRLWPLTATLPKGLLPVAGMPFATYQLGLLAAAGIEEAILAVGREHLEAWRRYVDDWTGVPDLDLSVEDEPLDTAGPVLLLRDRLDDRFLVLNGDVVLDVDLADFVDRASDTPAVLALVEVDDPSAYGVVVTDERGLVAHFLEKPDPGTAPADTASAGIYVLNRRCLDGFDPGPLSFETEVFPGLAGRNELGAVVLDGVWMDIGTPELYLGAHGVALRGESRLHRPADPHTAADGARIFGERSGGWSWVGEGAVVREDAVIREAVIMPQAAIHVGATVNRAIVGWGAEVHEGAIVAGAAVVGSEAVVGSGCELDHGARIAPGAKLGPGAVTFEPPD
ncbi:MAG: sugar phosphate nucleotidyltransferase [Acidimicrobiia bacterium]